MYEIEKEVLRPATISRFRRYPFAGMEVGDSFFVPESADEKIRRIAQRLSTSASSNGKRHGKKFTVRIVKGGVRVWRME